MSVMGADKAAYAVVGNPIGHSRSPEIHQSFARQLGLELRYSRLLAPVGGFAATVAQFFAAGGAGLNVTVPFKGDAALWCDRLLPAAEVVGAVNTIRRIRNDDGSSVYEGTNTDGEGLLMDLDRLHWPVTGCRVLLLGAGGAARGALYALLERKPTRLSVANRTLATAAELCNAFFPLAKQRDVALNALALSEVREDYDLIINATSLGLTVGANFAEVLPSLSMAGSNCYDMVYGEETAFLVFAARGGAKHLADGLGMLVGQAAIAFEWWHGARPDVETTLAELGSLS